MSGQHDNTSNAPLASTESDETPSAGTTTPETPQEAPEAPQKPNKEARYRVERNQAREELATANARIERMQQSELERLAAVAGLAMGSDLLTMSGNSVSDYLNEDGDVDAAKVSADAAAVLAERPGLGKNSPGYDPSQGLGGKVPPRGPQSWADLFRG